MGSKPWSVLGVLVLACAALTGCTSAVQKDKSLGAKIGDPPPAKLANTGPQLPGQTNNNTFPLANTNNQPKSNSLTPTGGVNKPNTGPNTLLPTSNNPANGGLPVPNFPGSNSNSSFAPSNNVPPPNPFGSLPPVPNIQQPSPFGSLPPAPTPQPPSPFASERTTVPNMQPPVPPLPPDFPPR